LIGSLCVGAGAFAQWERLLPAPVDLSVVNMLLENEPAPMLGTKRLYYQNMVAVFRVRIRMDPHSIGRLNPNPDPGGLKRAKMKGKNAAKREVIRHKKCKNQYNWYKNVYCDFIFKAGFGPAFT
jgi:hypothetical protein